MSLAADLGGDSELSNRFATRDELLALAKGLAKIRTMKSGILRENKATQL